MSHFTHECTNCGHDRERHSPAPAHTCPSRYCQCRGFVPGPSIRRETYSFNMDATDAPPASARVTPLQEPGTVKRYQRSGPSPSLCDCADCRANYAAEAAS